jgi:uncharacterized paraquat-inducible protein A
MGYLMLLIGAFLVLVGWSVVLAGSATATEMFLAMMVVQVIGIVLILYGWKVITDPSRIKVPPPPHYNEFSVVCERCDQPLPSGAESCPRCGNRIEWD